MTNPGMGDGLDISIELMKAISVLEIKRREFINNQFPDIQLTGAAFRIILWLDFMPGINQCQLADKLHIDKSGTARFVRKLEDGGLLYRVRQEEDRRNYMLYLTDAGKELAPEIRRSNREWNEIITQSIPEEQLNLTIHTLTQMVDQIPN